MAACTKLVHKLPQEKEEDEEVLVYVSCSSEPLFTSAEHIHGVQVVTMHAFLL